jgi:DNA-binding transcriptional LysR family regulator
MFNLMHVAVFQKVAEAKNITTAAKALGLTPSAVSRQISRLEDNLGIQLFQRSTRHLRLTEAGESFYLKTSHGLAELKSAVDVVSQMGSELRGTLQISAPPCFGRLHVIPALSDFVAANPKLNVSIVLHSSQRGIVESGADIIIRSAVLSENSLDFQDLAPMQHVICASPSYLQVHGIPRTPKDLQKHNCVILTNPDVKDEWRFGTPGDHVRVRVHGNFQADSTEALYAAVLAGVGIARIPNYVVGPDLASGRLRSILSNILGSGNRYEGPAITMKAYYLRSRYPSKKVQAFIDHLKKTLRATLNWTLMTRDVKMKQP